MTKHRQSQSVELEFCRFIFVRLRCSLEKCDFQKKVFQLAWIWTRNVEESG